MNLRNSKAHDDRFKASGKIKTSSIIFYWRQDKTKTKADGTKNVDVAVSKNKQCILLDGMSYLDKNGNIHFKYNNKRKFISAKRHTYRINHLFLVKAENLIRKEYSLGSMHIGWYNNQKGYKITTKGGLLLGSVAQAIGVEKIANKTTPLGTKSFDTIHDLLGLNSTYVVALISAFIGLKVDQPPNKRRRLMEGTSSFNPYRYLCWDCPEPENVFDGTLPRMDALEYALARALERNIPDPNAVHIPGRVVNIGVDLARNLLADRNGNYARELALYMARRGALFWNVPLDFDDRLNLQAHIRRLMANARAVRRGTIDVAEFNRMRGLVENGMTADLGHHLRLALAPFVRLLINNIIGLAGDDGVQRDNPYPENTLRRLVRAELLRLQSLRRVPLDSTFKISQARNDTDSDDGRGLIEQVKKNAFGLAVDLNIAKFVEPR